jgi:tetratricopeptide (TPR) repeat protein
MSLQSWWLAPALVLVGALILGCSTPEERFADHVERGEGFVASGDRQKALLEYHNALKIQPDHAELNERVGDLLSEQGASDDAAFFYREAYRLDPTNAAAALKEAQLVLFADPARAEDILARVEKRSPGISGVPRTRSEIHLLRGDLDGARAEATIATEVGPEIPFNWMQLAKAYQALIRQAQLESRGAGEPVYLSALSALDRADQADGGHLPAKLERGRVLATWSGHREEALKAFRDALAFGRESEDAGIRAIAGAAVAKIGRQIDNAELERDGLREIIAADETKLDAWARLARVEESLEAGAGDRLLQDLLGRRPKDPSVATLYANFLVANDRRLDAISHLEQVLEDGVSAPILWEQLLRLQLGRLQIANARATLVRMADAFPDEPMTRLAEARVAVVTSRHQIAAEILRALVTTNESYEAQRLLAIAEHRLGNLRQATVAINRGLELLDGRHPPEALLQKALIHHDAEQWDQTLGAYELLITTKHELSDIDRVRRARALYETGRRPGGRAILTRLLTKPAPHPAAAAEYFRREKRRDPIGARENLTKALQHSPGNFEILHLLTAIDVRTDEKNRALARLDQVIESRRVGPRILLLRAGLQSDAGRYREAEADALRAFESAPDSTDAVEQLLVIYRAQDKLDEARLSFEEADAAGVLHAGARLLLGRLTQIAGDTERARALFERVIEEQPNLAGARSDLAFLLATDPDSQDRALELAEEAAGAARRDSNVALVVGYVYLQTGRPEAAIEQLRKTLGMLDAMDATGARPLTHYYIGLALQALDREREAMLAFLTALALDEEFPNADDARRQIDGIRASERTLSSS